MIKLSLKLTPDMRTLFLWLGYPRDLTKFLPGVNVIHLRFLIAIWRNLVSTTNIEDIWKPMTEEVQVMTDQIEIHELFTWKKKANGIMSEYW